MPMLVIGLIFIAIGGSMGYSNQKKMTTTEQANKENIGEFVKAEKKSGRFPISLPKCSLHCYSGSLLEFMKNLHLHAIAIALTVFVFAFVVIDYFSKERSTVYYEQIINYTQQNQ